MAKTEIKRSQVEAEAREFLQRASKDGTKDTQDFERLVQREVKLTVQQLKATGKRVVD